MLCLTRPSQFLHLFQLRLRIHSSIPHFLTVAVVCLLVSAAALPMAGQIIVQNDFEDGTLQGWIPRGGSVVLTNTIAASHSGTHSLLTTGRTANFNGPSLNVTNTLTQGPTYQISGWVQLTSGEPPDTLKITMQRMTNGTQAFDQIAASAAGGVTDTGWVLLQGLYTVPSGTTAMLLYVEAANATNSYYLDDFSIVQLAAYGCTVPPDNSGFSSNFEDGTNQGWVSRGGGSPVVLTPTQADAHTGSWSLLVTGRTATWNGSTHDITGKMCNGSQYWLEVWVKMAPGQPTTSMNLSLQLTDQSGNSTFPGVTSATVTSSAWVRLKAKPYNFSGSYTKLEIYVQSNNNPTASFYIDDVGVTFLPPPVIEDIPSVAEAYSSDFLIGFAALQSDLSGPHGKLAARHFNSVTPANDLKWDTTEPTEGKFNFVPGDNILAFAQAHNIKMRGHTFVWHNQVPNWVFQDANGVDMSTQPFSIANKELLLSRMKKHITALINHYQDQIYVWDVVNEAIDESRPDGFRRSKWYIITTDPANNPGYPEYMDDAFLYAREALDVLGISRDRVKLCYNDFNTTIAAKRTFIYNWVRGAIDRGVPIDCVGNQFHNTINFPIDDRGSEASKKNVADTINLFASLTSTASVPIVNEITEFDISLYRFGNCAQTFYTDYDDLLARDKVDLVNEGYRYRDYFQIFKNLKNEIDSVTTWGLADDESWLNPASNKAGCAGVTAADAPLLFDAYLQHKYAYTAVIDPLDLPGANLTTAMAASPDTVLNGNPVSYVITVTNNGPYDAANLTLTDLVPPSTEFQSMVAPPGWTCTTPAIGGTGQVSCTTPTLANGSSAEFTLRVEVAFATPSGTTIGNSATATSTTPNPNLEPNNTASVDIVVSDAPSNISGFGISQPVLSPLNLKIAPETFSNAMTGICGANPTVAVTLSRDQPVEESQDSSVIDARHLELRRERTATLGSRVYSVTVMATDSAGAASNESVKVMVPLS